MKRQDELARKQREIQEKVERERKEAADKKRADRREAQERYMMPSRSERMTMFLSSGPARRRAGVRLRRGHSGARRSARTRHPSPP